MGCGKQCGGYLIMLTHTIERWESGKQTKPKFISGSVDHRQYILDRNYSNIKGNKSFCLGAEWYAKGHKKKGTIIDIIKDLESVEWEGLKVKFIEMWFDGENNSSLFHPSDLRHRK